MSEIAPLLLKEHFMITYKLGYQINGKGLFAFVGIEFKELSEGNGITIDFSKMKKSNWSDDYFQGTFSLTETDELIISLKTGMLIACKELKITNINIIISSIKYTIVDALNIGFAFTGYQLIYKAVTGIEKYNKLQMKIY